MLSLKASHLATLAALMSLAVSGTVTVAETPVTTSAVTSINANAAKTEPSATAVKATEAGDKKEAPKDFTPEESAKLSEAIGHSLGRSLKDLGVQFDIDSVIRGMRSGMAGSPAPMSDQDFKKMIGKVQENAYNRLLEENLKAANAFMEKNKQASGVVEIEPGKLQYLLLQEGTGATVNKDSVPQIKYVGKYLDGTVFGDSEEVGGPITIPLGQTIQGFSRGLVGMKEGEKRRLFVHPDLGYGTMGQLPPNAMLIFDVEVVKADTPNYKPSSLAQMIQGGQTASDLDDDGDDDFDDDDNYGEEEDFPYHNSANRQQAAPPAASQTNQSNQNQQNLPAANSFRK